MGSTIRGGISLDVLHNFPATPIWHMPGLPEQRQIGGSNWGLFTPPYFFFKITSPRLNMGP